MVKAMIIGLGVRRCVVCAGLLLASLVTTAQVTVDPNRWVSQLNLAGALPEKLLTTRAVVFYGAVITEPERLKAQEYFQRTGVDAVVYIELDMLLANADATRTFANYLTQREIPTVIVIDKDQANYRIVITGFNGKETMIDPGQPAWSVTHTSFSEAIRTVYRTAANSLKKQNMLVNDVPETDYNVTFITGKRNEFYAMDLKVDLLAVPKTGDAVIDQEMEAYMQANYPLKFRMTEPGIPDRDLRKQGYLYVLRFVNARGISAKKLLGYDQTKPESAYVSVTYPDNQPVLKNIAAQELIYKVYFKHIESGNVFLGTKWDADVSWQAALRNQIKGMKIELKIP